jgi:hypothetical protein
MKIFLIKDIFSNISNSVLISKELVNSSNIKISGFLYKALAKPILCISPPDILDPFSPSSEFSPSGKLLEKTSKPENFIA